MHCGCFAQLLFWLQQCLHIPQVAIRTHHWTIVNAIVIWGISIGLWFPFMLICSFLWQWWELLPDMSGVAQRLFAVPAFWLSAVVGAPAIAVLFDFSVMVFEDQFRPSDARIFQVCSVAAHCSSITPSWGSIWQEAPYGNVPKLWVSVGVLLSCTSPLREDGSKLCIFPYIVLPRLKKIFFGLKVVVCNNAVGMGAHPWALPLYWKTIMLDEGALLWSSFFNWTSCNFLKQ